MTDAALIGFCEQLVATPGNKLLIADEHIDSHQLLNLKAIPNLTLISNRFDIAKDAEANNITCYFNDMNLDLGTTYDLIAYRVSKEKAIVHHVINQAHRYLSNQGRLLLCGHKNEGIKTYISKTEALFGCKAQTSKGERQIKFAEFSLQQLGEPLDDRAYSNMTEINDARGLTLYSKPGQFGWSKVDQGSEMLVDALEEYLSVQVELPKSMLDLGCGYGYLSVSGWALGIPKIIATDNNAAAIASCRYNFAQHQINGDVIADDAAASIHKQFPLIVCNPPFHKGFDVEQELTLKFLKSAAHHLKKNGVAFFVVNQFIPLERIAVDNFKVIQTVRSNKSFKVLKLSF